MMVLKLFRQVCPDKIPLNIGSVLGDGADGEVFSITNDNGKVIKLCVVFESHDTNPIKEYNRIDSVLNYLENNDVRAYARVYEHQFIGSYSRIIYGNITQNYILYYYVMNKLIHISEDESKVFHTILSHEDSEKEKNFSNNQIKKILEGMQRGLDFDAECVKLFIEHLRSTPIFHFDVHPRNIMKDSSGNFKLIDFDRSKLLTN